MNFTFEGEAIHWRGPAPYVFVPLPPEMAAELQDLDRQLKLSYGWGVIPATVQIGGTRFRTALFPRQGSYLVPIKVLVQRAEGVAVGDRLQLRLELTGEGLAGRPGAASGPPGSRP